MHAVYMFLKAMLFSFCLAEASAAERTIYFIPDAQGSPVAAMDASGNVLWREAYAPYGARTVRSADSSASPAYTGKPEDADTGFIYMGARWYDPETARFTGIDPIGFALGNPQSFGRYLYANNSPYMFLDPNGEAPTPLDALLLAYDAGAWAMAMYSGNPAAIAEASADLGMSLAGLAVPIPGGGLALKAAKAAENAAGVKTNYGVARQGQDTAALAAREAVENGAPMYKAGTLGKSDVTESQFFALEHPGRAGYADRYGIPQENIDSADFMITAKLKPGTDFVTRQAPGVGKNSGGGIEVVVPRGGAQVTSFTMDPPRMR